MLGLFCFVVVLAFFPPGVTLLTTEYWWDGEGRRGEGSAGAFRLTQHLVCGSSHPVTKPSLLKISFQHFSLVARNY